MKSSALKLVWFTTLYLVTFAVVTQFDVPVTLGFAMMIFGQLLVVFMVYRVLTNHYIATKTFKDWYDDMP